MFELQHLCAHKRIRHQVSHVIPLLVSTTPSLFQSTTTRSTHLDSTTFSKTTLYTKNRLFARTSSPKLPGRKAALKNHSRTSIMRVAETRAQHTPTGYEPNELTTKELATTPTMSSGRYSSIIRCTERIWRTRSTSSNY